jgi:hypothetical protein
MAEIEKQQQTQGAGSPALNGSYDTRRLAIEHPISLRKLNDTINDTQGQGTVEDPGALPQDEPKPKSPRQQRVRKFIDSTPALLFMMACVVVGVVVESTSALAKEDKQIIESVLLAVFVLDCSARAFAMGFFDYITDTFAVVDLIVTVIDILATVISAQAGEESGNAASIGRLGRALRILRFARILRCARILNAFHLKIEDRLKRKVSHEEPTLFFRLLDRNHDGSIGMNELKRELDRHHILTSAETLTTIFDEIQDRRQQGLFGELAEMGSGMIDFVSGEEEEDEVTVCEFEAYVMGMQPSTKMERRFKLTLMLLGSKTFWCIIAFFSAGRQTPTRSP